MPSKCPGPESIIYNIRLIAFITDPIMKINMSSVYTDFKVYIVNTTTIPSTGEEIL
jgi:hypothetical protein